MGASERAGRQPARYSACLEPQDYREEEDDESLALPCEPIDQDILDALVPTGIDGDREDWRDADEIGERSARLAADRESVAEHKAAGFSGPKYEIFKAGLAAYGIPVVRAWIRRRSIYALVEGLGRGVMCPEDVREHLASDKDDRQELALETVAEALNMFEQHALIDGAWSAHKGASLTTYFIGSCLAEFPNVFRRWHTQHRHWQRTDLCGLGQADETTGRSSPLDQRIEDDPADTAVANQTFLDELRSLPERVCYVVAAMVFRGCSYAEVAAEMGTTENAIKQLVYRYRKEAHHRRAGREET